MLSLNVVLGLIVIVELPIPVIFASFPVIDSTKLLSDVLKIFTVPNPPVVIISSKFMLILSLPKNAVSPSVGFIDAILGGLLLVPITSPFCTKKPPGANISWSPSLSKSTIRY